MKRTLVHGVAFVALIAASPFLARAAADHAGMPGMEQASAAGLTAGEVKKVDTDQGKVTIKHGPLDNLGMPAMTMVFRVADPAMLARIKPGDAIRFAADRVNGNLTVIRLEP